MYLLSLPRSVTRISTTFVSILDDLKREGQTEQAQTGDMQPTLRRM
jgi:hypothetical protein